MVGVIPTGAAFQAEGGISSRSHYAGRYFTPPEPAPFQMTTCNWP